MKAQYIIIASAMVFILAGCSSLARRAVLPGSYLTSPQNIVPESNQYELLSLQAADGSKISAQFGHAMGQNGESMSGTQATVVFFYGNRMCIAGSQEIFDDFRRMGVNVLIPEYPGYGMSGGVASEQACYLAAEAAYNYLCQRSDIDRSKIVVAGLSIGCGPAVDLASRHPVAGLVLVVPLSNTREVGSDLAPWYLRWAVPMLAKRAAFDNLAKIPQVKCPILLLRASRDQVTSSKRSDELLAAARTNVENIVVDSDHDGSWRAGRSAVGRWLNSNWPYPQP